MIAGSILMFAGSTAPEGFLICDGSAVSRTTYSTLYDTIGNTYGSGDGSTTFNLPDLIGRVAIGASTTYTIGSSGGEEMHVLTLSEIPIHNHTVPSHGHQNNITITTPTLTHSVTQPAFNYEKPNGSRACGNTRQNITCYNGTSSVNASRNANVAMANHSATACTMSGSITDCNTFNTETTGTDSSHSNMQPYITLNYVISTGE